MRRQTDRLNRKGKLMVPNLNQNTLTEPVLGASLSVRESECEPLIAKRAQVTAEFNGLSDAKVHAVKIGDARVLREVGAGLLTVGPALVDACAELDAALDKIP